VDVVLQKETQAVTQVVNQKTQEVAKTNHNHHVNTIILNTAYLTAMLGKYTGTLVRFYKPISFGIVLDVYVRLVEYT